MATENLTSLFVVVPKTSKSDWLGNYEKLSDFVVRCSFPACAEPVSGPLTPPHKLAPHARHKCPCVRRLQGRRVWQAPRAVVQKVEEDGALRSKVGDSAL